MPDKEKKNRSEHSHRLTKAVAVIYAAAIITVALGVFIVSRFFEADVKVYVAFLVVAVICSAVAVIISCLFMRRHNLAREKDTLENYISHLSGMAILWDTNFDYIRVNDAFVSSLGYSAEDLKDREILEKVLPPAVFLGDLEFMSSHNDERFTAFSKDGSRVCTIWNTSLMVVYDNETEHTEIMLSIGTDLTEIENMRTELAASAHRLEESENRYSLSMELSEIGLLLKEEGSSRFYASEQLRRMLALDDTKSSFVSGSELRELFHPKDRPVFDNFSTKLTCGSVSGEAQYAEFRALSSDGDYHWYQFRYKAVPAKNALRASIGGAVIDITAEKEKDLMIERLAYIDEVTQINNRNKFMLIGHEMLTGVRDNPNIDYWVIVFDIDSFHIINDTCGYETGNRMLAKIASVVTASLTEGGIAARIGGDNFAVIVKTSGDDEDLPVAIIKHVQEGIASIDGDSLETQNITCSAGYCRMSDSDGDFSHVLDHAEFALSLTRDSRSSIVRYDHRAHDAIIAGNEIEKDLAKAIDSSELALYYQPKISLQTGKVVGMEALIRWIKPDGRVVPPSDFIPVAESSLLITKISRFVLYEACRQNKVWQDMGLEPVTVSINLSAIDFYQTNVTEIIRDALSVTGLEAKWLDVELTETLALKDIDHAIMQMKEIKSLGVKLSMDDFGTGYSSLSYIQVLPISLLKLDRSFIMYLEEDEISREIVSAVIRIAKSKKIETIAEGIETIGQAQILKQSGCDQAQGFYFGKPMPADKFEDYLRTRQTLKV